MPVVTASGAVLHQQAVGVARQAHKTRQFAQVVVHQGHVSGFDRSAGAGGTHGKTNVGSCQRRGVVDAIPHHTDQTTLADQLFNGLAFVLGQQVTTCLGDASLHRHRPCSVGVVTGQHQGLDAQRM